jgi:hypothetical protein
VNKNVLELETDRERGRQERERGEEKRGEKGERKNTKIGRERC